MVASAKGFFSLGRPALYDSHHGIVNLSRLEEYASEGGGTDSVTKVVGPICESGDILGICQRLPSTTQPGDIILICNGGAYGAVMSSRYNLREAARELIIDDHKSDDV